MINELILGAVVACAPFWVKSGAGVPIQHNCTPLRMAFIDQTWDRAMRDHSIRASLRLYSEIVVGPYYANLYPCYPSLEHAVVPSFGHCSFDDPCRATLTLMLNSRVIRDEDETALYRAFSDLAWSAEHMTFGQLPPIKAEAGGCTR